jgi:hypothetical protein
MDKKGSAPEETCDNKYSATSVSKMGHEQLGDAVQLAEKPLFLSFRGALRAEESLFSCV